MNPSSAGTAKPIAMFPSPHRQSGGPPQHQHQQQQQPSLSRYGSAPGSLLTSLADSVIGGAEYHQHHHGGAGSDGYMGRFFSGEASSLTSESSCKASASPPDLEPFRAKDSCPQRSYGAVEISLGDLTAAGNSKGGGGGGGGGGGNPLVRHSSSPAGFFSQLMGENGFPVTRDPGNYSRAGSDGVHAMANRRLKSQLSFSRQSNLSQISEFDISEMGNSIGGSSHSDEVAAKVGHSYVSGGFSIGSWDDTNSIMFSAPSSKRAKDNNEEIITSLSNIESQFSLPRTSLEMAAVEKYLQIQQDQVPFKVRAKRGCATHPRSIAERERRTRISEKLRKLQELVPNMDKQTSTSDMLDLAVQHIKGLQSQVQTLAQERDNCTCGNKHDKN